MSVPVTKFCISAPSVSFHLLHDTGAGNSGTAFTCYQLDYYAALSAVVWMMVVVQRGDQRGVQGVKRRKELYEASCLLPILGELLLSEMAVSSHHITGRSCLFVPFQRCQDQLSGDRSAEMGVLALWGFFCKLLNFTVANLFPLFPCPRWQLFLAVAISCSVFAFSVMQLTIPWAIFSLLSIQCRTAVS